MNAIECRDEADWLKARKILLTASDIASIFNANPFKSELALWAEKTGAIEPDDPSQSEPVQWGKEFQGAIGRRFAAKTGREVEPAPPYAIWIHPDVEFLGATLDFWETDTEKGKGVLETKATTIPWQEEPPVGYQIQLQCQLAITRMPYGTLCAFNGMLKPPVWADMAANDAFIKRLIAKAEAFWWRVKTRNPPPVENDPSESTREVLAALYPRDAGTQIALPPEALEWASELDLFAEQQKTLKEQVNLRKNRIKALMGDATFGVLADGTAFKWATEDVPAHPVKEFSRRVLRHVKGVR